MKGKYNKQAKSEKDAEDHRAFSANIWSSWAWSRSRSVLAKFNCSW